MFVAVIDCEIFYNGRGKSFLPRGERLLIIKDDNTVLIHQNENLKPINYMSKSINISWIKNETNKYLLVDSKKEHLKIKIFKIIDKLNLSKIIDNNNIQMEGTEKQLQEKIAHKKKFQEIFGNNAIFLDKEYDTTKGLCDLIGVKNNRLMLIEIKRIAHKNDVYQVIRYKDGIKKLLENMEKENADFTESRKGKKIYKEWLKNPLLYLIAPEIKNGVKDYAKEKKVIIKKIRR